MNTDLKLGSSLWTQKDYRHTDAVCTCLMSQDGCCIDGRGLSSSVCRSKSSWHPHC